MAVLIAVFFGHRPSLTSPDINLFISLPFATSRIATRMKTMYGRHGVNATRGGEGKVAKRV